MLYDLMIELLKLCGGMFGYFKDHPETLGVIILLLRQHFIKKFVNQNLPKQFRDTHESDIQEIKQGVQNLTIHLGVPPLNTQQNGLRTTPTLSYKRFFLFLRKAKLPRRKVFMEKLKSRKFWLTILAALIPVINKEFNIDLDLGSTVSIMAAIMAGVAALAHVDAKKLLAKIVHPTVTATGTSDVSFDTFKEAKTYLQTIHDGVNKLLEDVRKDDGSQAFKDAMETYIQIQAIIEANKNPEPLPTIPESQVSA